MADDADGGGHVRLSLGLYVLGGLDRAACERVEVHLRGCESCRTEQEYIAVVPALFNVLSPDDLAYVLLDGSTGPSTAA